MGNGLKCVAAGLSEFPPGQLSSSKQLRLVFGFFKQTNQRPEGSSTATRLNASPQMTTYKA